MMNPIPLALAISSSWLLCASPTWAFVSPGLVARPKLSKKSLQRAFQSNQERRKVLWLLRGDDGEESSPELLPQSAGLISTVLLPATEALSDATDGWALTYADLRPESDRTVVGLSFLATNVAYAIVGLLLQFYYQDLWLGTMIEIASVASFSYHYNQLARPKEQAVVRFAMMIDYVIAAVCLGTTSFYLLSDPSHIPLVGYLSCALAVMFLVFSWIWEEALPYCFNHGLWHILGAYGGFIIGQAHAAV